MDNVIKLTGPNESHLHVKEVKGRYYQAHPGSHGNVEDVHSQLKARPDDVIICSFPKSGLHYIWEIVTMLRRRSADLVTHLAEGSLLEVRQPGAIEHLPSPRVLATHCRPEQLPTSIRESGTQLICLFRDPRAIAVSSFHFCSKLSGLSKISMPWNDYLYFYNNGLVPFNSWFTYAKLWSRFIKANKDHHRIHVVNFEDLKKDPVGEIKRLNEILGQPCDMGLIQAIANKTEFKQLKSNKQTLASLKQTMFDTGKYEIYRKGEVDDWKDHYTVRQNEEMIKLFNSKCQGTGLTLRSSL